MSDRLRKYYLNTIEERRLSSIEIRSAYPIDDRAVRAGTADPNPQQAIWFRSRIKLPNDEAFHKSVLAYASDFTFISTVPRVRLSLHPGAGHTSCFSQLIWYILLGTWIEVVKGTQAGYGGQP